MKIQNWTPMIRTGDMKYPVYLSDFRAEYPNSSIGSFMYEENMVEFGYFPVHDVDIPVGDVVTEGFPVKNEDGLWYKTWEVRDFTPEEVSANLEAEKTDVISQAYQVFLRDMSTGVTIGEEVFITDPAILTNLYGTYVASKNADPEEVFHIRTGNNTVLSLPSTDAFEKVTAIFTAQSAVYQRFLFYVKSVSESTTKQGILPVPASFLGE